MYRSEPVENPQPLPQDLHVHTTFSSGDSAVAPEQSVELVASLRHAAVLGISDHAEYVSGDAFGRYRDAVLSRGFRLGVEVDGSAEVDEGMRTSQTGSARRQPASWPGSWGSKNACFFPKSNRDFSR